MSRVPWFLKLPRGAMVRRDVVLQLALASLSPRGVDLELALHAFAFKNDEYDFARALLERHPQLWVYRTHQQSRFGDFLVVDMSSPSPERRAAWAVELKQNSPLRAGGGGAGMQFMNVPALVGHVARETGVIAPGASVMRLSGDRAAVLAALG